MASMEDGDLAHRRWAVRTRLFAGAEWIRTFSSALEATVSWVRPSWGRSTGAPVIRAVTGLGIPIDLSGDRPRNRHSPPGSGGSKPRPRCRRCERIAVPNVRIRSPPAASLRTISPSGAAGTWPMRPRPSISAANLSSPERQLGAGPGLHLTVPPVCGSRRRIRLRPRR